MSKELAKDDIFCLKGQNTFTRNGHSSKLISQIILLHY